MAHKLRIKNNVCGQFQIGMTTLRGTNNGVVSVPFVAQRSCRPLLAKTWMAGTTVPGSSPGTAMTGLRVAVSAK